MHNWVIMQRTVLCSKDINSNEVVNILVTEFCHVSVRVHADSYTICNESWLLTVTKHAPYVKTLTVLLAI